MMQLQKFKKTLLLLFLLLTSVSTVAGILVFYIADSVASLPSTTTTALAVVAWLITAIITGYKFVEVTMRPTSSVYRALEHMAVGPGKNGPPNPEADGLSKDIVETLIKDVYTLSSGQHEAQEKTSNEKAFVESVVNNQSNALLTLDRNRIVTYANLKAREIMPKSIDNPIGMTLEDIYEPDFSSGVAFNEWFSSTQAEKIQDRRVWEKVRIMTSDESITYYDLIADYNKNESHGIETIVVLVDKTASYSADDNEVNFVSLAVHELRSPISMLRGYIEVFEEELGPGLDAGQRQFMNKMSVAAGQLSVFVNNILNVARVENDQLKVHLQEDDVATMINSAAPDFTLRAQVRNRKLTFDIASDLVSVGLDRVGMYEILSNLIDNAIKYSKDAGEIQVAAANNELGVAISVTDHGVGIPESSLENLFERFYRSHHSRDKVAGTGLGLFLSKTLVEAHGGEIEVQSTEGQGSVFTILLPSYSSIKQELEDGDGTIVRSAHGWIKNHGRLRK